MSIASRITSIENHLSNDYVEIVRLGADLTNVDKNIENIAETIREAYSKMPKVLGTGSNLSLSPTLKGGLDITPIGNCEQDSTSISGGDEYDSPTPDHPQDIRVVTGDNDVVVSNKNLLSSIEIGGIDTNTGANQLAYSYARCDYIQVIGGNNISVQYKDDSVERGQIVIYEYDKYKNYLGFNYANAKTYSRTLLSNTAYIRLRLEGSPQSTLNEFYEYQVEYSDTPTSYVLHAEQKVTLHNVPDLAGIGDYVDTIEGKTNDWKVVRKVGKVVLDGSEQTWSLVSSGETPYYRFRYITGAVNSTNIFSNMFIKSTISTTGSELGCSITTTGEFRCREQNMKTLENWLTFLSTHNLIVYYVLETPTEETITDTTLINDLNELYEARGYDGQTNITISSNSANAQMTAQVSALKGE